MSVARRIVKKGLALYKRRNLFTFKDQSLLAELQEKIFLEKGQIDYWVERYNANPIPITHPYIEIAQMLTNVGLHDEASRYYKRYLAKHNEKSVHGLYLQNLLLSDTATNQSLLQAHKEWASRYDVPWRRLGWKRKADKTQNRKLKIGYICHFFTNSISQNVMLPFLKLHDRNRFEIYCYDDGETSPEYHGYADHWRDIRGLTDKEVAQRIKNDGIDILQEANGFCIINRFGALSYRPAPIQINWYNHTSTTGLPYVDYVMSDKISIPESDLSYFTEEAYRSERFIAAINFDVEKFGEIALDPPSEKTGITTFAYFGGSHKITLSAIKLWSEVLKRVPNSKLILKGATFTHDTFRRIFKKHFSQFGIDDQRVEFEGWSDQASTLRKYNEIDIMLDNIPVTGGSTLFEALMQGVPVITLLGNRWAARSGASVLTALNHRELIAASQEEYISLAVNLSKNKAALANYRANLRQEMLASSLASIESCYKNFENAYLKMWDVWVRS